MATGGARAHALALSPSSSEPWRKEGRGCEIGLEAEAGAQEKEEQEACERREEGRLCAPMGPPSWAQNKEAWGNKDTTSNQPPRDAQGRRLLGPAALRTCPLASLLSHVRARLGPGGYSRRSGNGGTQTCLPAACGVAQGVAQYGPSSSTHAQDPREGPSLAGRTTGGFLGHSLVRLAHEEAERSRRGYLARCS